MCRIVTLEHFSHESIILFRLQWYGADYLNSSSVAEKPKWYSGGLEKVLVWFTIVIIRKEFVIFHHTVNSPVI